MQSIYDPNGLRDLALYLDDLLEGPSRKFNSQNEFGEIAGVPPNTIKSIRGNRDLTRDRFEEGKFHKPTLESLLAIAAVIPDPLTGESFDPEGRPCRLEAVARGWESLFPKTASKKAEQTNPTIALIQSAYKKNKQRFVRSGISEEALSRILAGDRPSIGELLQLAEALNINLEKMLELYGVARDTPLPNENTNGGRAKSPI